MEEREVCDADYEPLWKLHVDTLSAYVGATWGWDEADQRRRFHEGWSAWKSGSVLVDGGAIAAAWRTVTHDDHVELSLLEVAPCWQNRGVGSQLVLRVVSAAAREGKTTLLRVLKVNRRAARFYFRLGFTQIGEGPTHLELASRPNSALSLGSL